MKECRNYLAARRKARILSTLHARLSAEYVSLEAFCESRVVDKKYNDAEKLGQLYGIMYSIKALKAQIDFYTK